MELIRYNFTRIRTARGLTQEAVAELGKVSKGYIGGIEAGLAKSFSARAEAKWAKLLNASIADFFLEPGQIIIGTKDLMNLANKPEIAQKIATSKLQQAQSELEGKFEKPKKKKTA